MLGLVIFSGLQASAAPTNAANLQKLAGLSIVPKAARINYQDYQQWVNIYPSAYANWKPPAGRVKICATTFYLGNTFQQENEVAMANEVKAAAKAGWAKPGFTFLNSNNSTATAISQFQSEVQDGCNVIFAGSSISTTAFCPLLKNAYNKGILVFSGSENCNYDVDLQFAVYQTQYNLAKGLAQIMHNKGNVIIEQGVPGIADAETATAANFAVFKKHPGIHVVGQIPGDWTASVASTATAQWLSTHPTKVDGIMDQGAMGVAAEQALTSAGRPLAKVSLQESDCQELAFDKDHPGLVGYLADQAPGPGVYADFYVLKAMLNGQKPKLDTIVYPIPGPTKATFNQWYTSSMTESSACFASPAPAVPALKTYLPQFLTGGTPVAGLPIPTYNK